jgi:formylglycine-generating enzyme required for sulfatase activity
MQNITITANGVTFTMVAVQGGTFTMGATSEQGSDAYSDEKPAHRVTLSNYYIGQTEVTQALWQAVMGSNPSYFKGSNLPVENVSWNDCQQFITKLNQLTGRKFRLPTEAEWEYAASGGVLSRGYKYSGSNDIGSVAWYSDNSGKKTHPVGQKQANELGIYDMSGNVLEWCQDWYDKEYYSKSPSNNPCNNISASCRVIRGGDWIGVAGDCRVAIRSYDTPVISLNFLGLRLAL